MPALTARSLRLAAASAGLVALSSVTLVNLASSALFTDQTTSGPTAVTSGTVVLSLGGTTVSDLAATASAPGDERFALLTVTNGGTLELRYSAALGWSQSNAFTKALQFGVIRVASPTATCDGTLPWTAPVDNGTVLARNVAAPGTSIPLFGSSSTGAQTGDRTLAAGTSEYLCVRQYEPTSYSTNSALSADLTIRFDAEQTSHNA